MQRIELTLSSIRFPRLCALVPSAASISSTLNLRAKDLKSLNQKTNEKSITLFHFTSSLSKHFVLRLKRASLKLANHGKRGDFEKENRTKVNIEIIFKLPMTSFSKLFSFLLHIFRFDRLSLGASREHAYKI